MTTQTHTTRRPRTYRFWALGTRGDCLSRCTSPLRPYEITVRAVSARQGAFLARHRIEAEPPGLGVVRIEYWDRLAGERTTIWRTA